MARIYKTDNDLPGRASVFGSGGLQEFPDVDRVTPEVEAEEAEPEEELPDPEEIRAAVLAEAIAEAEQIKVQAREEGFAAGQEAGEAEFTASTAQCAEALHAAAAAVQEVRQTFVDALEPQVLELVKALTQCVLRRELKEDPSRLVRVARKALEQLADQQALTIRVNPEDHEAMQLHRVTLLDEFDVLEDITIESDEEVSPGGCLVDSREVQFDVQYETLLKHVFDDVFEQADELD